MEQDAFELLLALLCYEYALKAYADVQL